MEEMKTFSEVTELQSMFADAEFQEILKATSSSPIDAANRQAVYSEVMKSYNEMKEAYKAFSGYAEVPLLSNQYFNASISSYVRSFAGFLTIERSMDQPTALLWYNDFLGVVDNRVVLPNIGQENLDGINARFSARAALSEGMTDYYIATNKKLIPGSVEMHLIHAANPRQPITIKDDRQGNLLAPAGVLKANADGKPSINYLTGNIAFSIGDGFVIAENDSYEIIGFEDVAGDPAFGQLTGPGNNRFKTDMKNIQVTAEPDMLVAENNLMSMAAAQKAVGFNMQEIIGQKLTELYTKLVNGKLTHGIMRASDGNAYTIDMEKYLGKFTDFQSRLDAFASELINIDTLFAKKTMKAVKATAYLVGEGVGNWFRKLVATGRWTDNTDSTYVNDLLGYYNGIPVLRHMDVPFGKGYAVHKTVGGEVAPLMRGIYLPLTNMPMVSNYNNPSQFATGVYYQEANEPIFPELIQEFDVTGDIVAPFDVRQVG